MHRLWQLLLAEFVCRGDDIFVVHFLAIASYAAFVAFTWCGHEVRNVVRTSGGDVCVCFTDRRLPDPWYLVLYFWRRISALVPIVFIYFTFSRLCLMLHFLCCVLWWAGLRFRTVFQSTMAQLVSFTRCGDEVRSEVRTSGEY